VSIEHREIKMSSQLPILITAEALREWQAVVPDVRIIDCQAFLSDPDAGRRSWLEAHIPGAVHADLEKDLSGPVSADTGRHPLPDPMALAEKLGSWGVSMEVPVVVYDDAGGAFAVRCWWLLRWLGHTSVAVLDGGLKAWQDSGGELARGPESMRPARFQATPGQMPTMSSDEVQAALTQEDLRLIDARGAARFNGEEEPIDPVAGHVPGAVNLPFSENLDAQGSWRSPEDLKARFEAVLPPFDTGQTAHMCGSGITACHNLFAMELAGLNGSALYTGSWSEWIRDPARPVVTGDG
jgi:thiosulfate/3-mercaptopyruvate sulfurtransferase